MLAADPRSERVRGLLSQVDRAGQDRLLNEIASSRVKSRELSHASRALPSARVGLFPGCHFPANGEQRALVVLVEYKDVPFTLDDPYDYFSRLLNQPGFSDYDGTGSARDYFIENSCGQFIPEFDVVGPVTLDHDRQFYGGNSVLTGDDVNAAAMVVEACQKIDDEVDFSQYDRDGDGFIDNVFVFYAGRGEASGGPAESVWPHSWNITKAYSEAMMFDGVQLDYYACTNEWTRTRPDGIGTFVHEFSHVMGLPDLYSTSGTSASFTPGAWSVMDYGPYNNNGCTPPMYSVFERYALGWLDPIQIDEAQNATLPPIGDNVAGIISTNFPNEFYLIENRQPMSWDTYIPGHGMLVWHVDYVSTVWDRNSVNNNSSHQYVDLVEADGLLTAESRDGDAFPGAYGVTEFTDETSPAMLTWAGKSMEMPFTQITETGEEVSFKVQGGREPIAAPEALHAGDVTATTATAQWKPTGADRYRLDFYCKDGEGNIIPVSRHYLGDVTSFELSELVPETYYYYTVRACDALEMSAPSEEIEFYTGHLTIDNLIVETLPVAADDDSSNGFTMSWLPIDDATSYYIYVYTKEPGEPYTDACGFDNQLSLPDGWNTDATLTYGMATWSGNAAPSLRMNGIQSLTSPVYDDYISAMSFWHRGSSTTADDKIVVSALAGEQWTEVGTYPIVTEKGGVVTDIPSLPAETKSVKITFDRAGNGNLALDDVEIKWGAQPVDTPLADYDWKEVGNVTSYTVDNLPDGTYYFSVKATDGELMSKPSLEREVLVGENSGVDSVISSNVEWRLDGRNLYVGEIADADYRVIDITGRILYSGATGNVFAFPAQGLYILSVDGGNPVKIIVK